MEEGEMRSSGGSASGTLTLDSNGSFARSNRDSGKWLLWHGNVVLNVFSSTVGDVACIYLGTAETAGIGSRDDPGPSNCHEKKATWYAVRSAHATISRAGPMDATASNGPSETSVTGTYDESDTSGYSAENLTIQAAGNYLSPGLELGFWVAHNGAIAFAVVSSQDGARAGCTFIGIPTTGGIDPRRSPGLLDCNGHRYRWHATGATV
jgi:hypothetical protein